MKAIVVLPTYNEKDNIESIVREILREGDVSMVIVDDDSPDGTGEIADRLALQNPDSIRVIHRKERGRRTAHIAGFKYALEQDADCIIEMDADFSHDPKDIPRFLEEIRSHDLVIGSRFIKGGKEKRNFFRRIMSKGASWYLQLALGRQVKDWQSGYKCYRKEALATLDFDHFLSNFSPGYSMGIETVYRLIHKDFSYKEIPIFFQDRERGASKFSLKEIWAFIQIAIMLRRSPLD
jgi:dolichol-phosphate mannosyltransferase